MTDEEKAAAEKEAAKQKKAESFLDRLADKVVEKQSKAAAAQKPPSRDKKPDPILDDTITGDEDIDEFIWGKPEAPAKPEEGK